MGCQRFVEFLAILKSRWTHPFRRSDALSGFAGIGNKERAEFAAEKASGVEGFQFFAFAHVKTLADVDKGWDRRIFRAERPRDDRADVGARDRLRRRIAGVPLILVPGVENEAEIARRVGTDKRSPIHHAPDLFRGLPKI